MPASPSPASRSRCPSSMPAGTVTVMVCEPSTRPEPRQSVQRCFTTSPAPPHSSQGRLMRKKPCWNMSCPVPRQRAQRSGEVPGLSPDPSHFRHGRILGIRILDSVPGEHVRQLDLEVVAEVGAALAAAPPAARAGALAEEVAEEIVEDVGEVAEVAEVGPGAAGSSRADASEPEAVVGAPLLRIREHGVGFGGFLEALLRRRCLRGCGRGATRARSSDTPS